jgi:hypothetical protein
MIVENVFGKEVNTYFNKMPRELAVEFEKNTM